MQFLVTGLVCLAVAMPLWAQAPKQETVVVTGTWQAIPLEESDRTVQAYSLRDSSLLFGTLWDALNLDSSVQLQSRGGVQADLSIRGGTFEQELILLDGIRLSDAQSAHHDLDIPVPIDAIDRLEILHGSGSTLYGSEAVAGVVNVVTREAAPHTEVRVRAGYGSFQTNEQSGFAALAVRKFSERLSAERELSGGFMDDRDYRNLVAASETWLRTPAGLTKVYLSLMDRPFGANQFYGNYNSWERTKAWLATLSQGLGKKTLFTLGFRRHTDLYELFRTNPDYYTNRHQDTSWDAALRRQDTIGHNANRALRAFYGAEFLADHVDSTNLGIHSRKQAAIYGAFSVQAGNRFLIEGGLREEFYGSAQRIAIPSISGSYWLSSKAKWRASVSRAFRLPNYTDLYYHDPANQGNPRLQPEHAMNYEAGIDYRISEKLSASATVFDRRETNDIDYVRANSANIWQAMNFGHVNFSGLEARVKWGAVDVEYSMLHGAQSALTGFQSKYAFNFPTQQGIVAWQRLAAHGLLMRARLGATNQIDRPAYLLLDASAAWTRYAVRPYLRLTNISNTSYQPIYGVLQPGRAVLGGLEWCLWCGKR